MDRSEPELVMAAARGERAALEEIIRLSQDRVFNLALRALGDPEEAADASQEILLKISRGIGSFQGRSALSTWTIGIAINHLRGALRREGRRRALAGIESLDPRDEPLDPREEGRLSEGERRLLAEESRRECAKALVCCLEGGTRLAYVLSRYLGIGSDEGASLLGISADAYRKRLSRAGARIASYLSGRCGLNDPGAECRCGLRLPFAELAKADGPIEVAERIAATGARDAGRFREDAALIELLGRSFAREMLVPAPAALFRRMRGLVSERRPVAGKPK